MFKRVVSLRVIVVNVLSKIVREFDINELSLLL